MKISNIKIKDFRNIVNADVNFGKINILTGKNSSGKSNFLLALTHSLSSKKDYSDLFEKNIVTFQKGKNRAVIKTIVTDINIKTYFMLDRLNNSFIFFGPEKFEFEKIIEKKTSLSKTHKLFYTGEFYNNKDSTMDVKTFQQSKNRDFVLEYKDKNVLTENFSLAKQEDDNQIITISKSNDPDQEYFLSLFSEYNDQVVSFMKNNDNYKEFLGSATLIHQYVTLRGDKETYEEVIAKLKQESEPRNYEFSKSKFIFLIADLQKDPKVKEIFKENLTIYTKGIVTDISIETRGSNKGSLVVCSPNGPKDIWTISNGTSILVFFICVLSWSQLNFSKRTYNIPKVMIFDEIDANIHPAITGEFAEVLKRLSEKVQLFMSSHSPIFINNFEKDQIYMLKDSLSMPGNENKFNRCNIYDYKTIINNLPEEFKKDIMNKSNSELFVEDLLDKVFPFIEKND